MLDKFLKSNLSILAICLFAVAGVCVDGHRSEAATITVNTILDDRNSGDGHCTLREAIINANDNTDTTSGDCVSGSGADVIAFNIPGAGSHDIDLTDNLPGITGDITINGTTQTGTTCDSRLLKIMINAQDGYDGLSFSGSGVENVVVKGLSVVRTSKVAVNIAQVQTATVECMNIGFGHNTADVQGLSGAGLAIAGAVTIDVGGNSAAQANYITTDNAEAVDMQINGVGSGTIQGNRLNINESGNVVGTSSVGIFLRDDVNNITVGGVSAGEGNLISSATVAVQINNGDNNSILGNRLWNNSQLGIDLGGDGVTSNDGGDWDSGINELLNFPEITRAQEYQGTVTVSFNLDVPAGDYRVEFFRNPSGADLSGYGEGETFAGATTVTHTGSGVESFVATFPGSAGDIITATTTEDPGGGDYAATSEFSMAHTVNAKAIIVVDSILDDTTAGDGNCTLREAILNADDNTDYTEGDCAAGVDDDVIQFNIPGTGAHDILLVNDLPPVSGGLIIDGTTQAGTTCSPRLLTVMVDGQDIGNGISFNGTGAESVVIKGFSIVRTGKANLVIESYVSATVECMNIGIGHDTTDVEGLHGNGLNISGVDMIDIGGSTEDETNYITTNQSERQDMMISNVSGGTIQGNHFNTDESGNVIGASGSAVYFKEGVQNVVVGGDAAGEANVISNATIAVQIDNGNNNAILGNRIWDDTQMGIDLGGDGITGNDSEDIDIGPNDLLNTPVITSVSEFGGEVTVNFDLDVPAGDYRVEFFKNPSGMNPSERWEGETFITATTITHTGSGVESFTATFSGSPGDVLTATATEDAGGGSYGSTSEFSASHIVPLHIIVNSDQDDTTPGDGNCTLREAIQNSNDDTDYTSGDCAP